MKDQITITFKGEAANLYDVGYILTDIYQINSFAQYVDAGMIEKASKRYGEKAKGFNRYSAYNKEITKNTEIVKVEHGSVILTTALISLTTGIIITLVGARAKQLLEEDNEQDQFEMDAGDPILKNIIDIYITGQYGRGIDGFNQLMNVLENHNYDVTIISQNAYLIKNIANRTAKRIVKTIKRN